MKHGGKVVDRQAQQEQLEYLEISNETFTVGERIVGLGRRTRSPCRQCHDNDTSALPIEATKGILNNCVGN